MKRWLWLRFTPAGRDERWCAREFDRVRCVGLEELRSSWAYTCAHERQQTSSDPLPAFMQQMPRYEFYEVAYCLDCGTRIHRVRPRA